MTKDDLISAVMTFKKRLQALKREMNLLESARVGKSGPREEADAIATVWVEELRSPLEHRAKLPNALIEEMSNHMKELHRLNRPNSARSKYLSTLGGALYKFDDRFIVPIKQAADVPPIGRNINQLVPSLPNPEEQDYLQEAVECANAGHFRAAIVLGWCAAIDRAQRRVLALGFDKFNQASTALKNQTSGRYKRWNKEFKIASVSELQAIFDTDLIAVLQQMGLLEGNQSQRLMTCFEYRNHSAHPGAAPIEEPNLVAFFSDIAKIILTNEDFEV